jgi:flagellar hook protein FlgE
MFNSFSTALSALNASSSAMEVVGNNLANLNTAGFKESTVVFRDLVTQSIVGGVGEAANSFGTGTPLTVRQFTQGAVQSTGGKLDAAIQGEGFFVVQDDGGNQLFTRAGNMTTDKSGFLKTATGAVLQGWTMNPLTGILDTNGAIGNILLPVGALKAPIATSQMTVDMNLKSTAAADATSAFSTPVSVFDGLGTSHVLTLKFQKTDANTWSYQVQIPGEDINGGTPGVPTDVPGAGGTLNFDVSGQLTSPALGAPIEFDVTGFNDGASDMHISWDPYTAAGAGRITQFAQDSAPSASSQNGSSAAQLVSIGLGDEGKVMAQYSNGENVQVAQLAMASVRNPDSLIAVGNNDFQLSGSSANASIGLPGTGGRGHIDGGSIEASTVDIAREFTNLIVYQRGYEANSKVVTTADQLSQTTINLIR